MRVISTHGQAGNPARISLWSAVVAKRLQVDFKAPTVRFVEENGQPRPCAMGVPWVNPDTLETLALLEIPRTDPWGRPLPKTEKKED